MFNVLQLACLIATLQSIPESKRKASFFPILNKQLSHARHKKICLNYITQQHAWEESLLIMSSLQLPFNHSGKKLLVHRGHHKQCFNLMSLKARTKYLEKNKTFLVQVLSVHHQGK